LRISTVNESLESRVRSLAKDSDVLEAIASIRQDGGVAFALGDAALRDLFKSEIEVLESLGNTARDWSLIQVADGFNARRIRDCEFHGRVTLGRFKQHVKISDGLEVLAGLSRSTIADCVIGDNVLIRDVRLLANYVVGQEAIIVDCGRVTCRAGTTFGNGKRVPVALEGGGREVEIFAEIDVETAAVVASPGSRRHELPGYHSAIAEYREKATSDRGIIGPGARVWSVPRLEDTYLGPAAQVDGATHIARCTLVSTVEAPVVIESGAEVLDSVMQWGSRVGGTSRVEGSVLGEQVRVDRHAKVRDSIVGPNSEIGAGEVVSCLLGPFVGCTHQSLLISTYWPAGRGNVAYGANVGSNHTTRAPDQEFRAGEGLFLGLGVTVKFPCDFSRSPYSVIACGITLPPQQVTFPFSLLAAPQEEFPEVPRGYNQISPAWMLRENIYALKRNEAKFRARDRARRSQFDYAVFRKETVEQMQAARLALAQVSPIKTFYTAQDIAGLGRNVLAERDRVRAIEAYRFHTVYYALRGLSTRVGEALPAGGSLEAILTTVGEPGDWEFQRNILIEEAGIESVAAGLTMLASMAAQVAKDCERTRAKDDTRGARIIPDYAEVHPPAERDRVVRRAWEEVDDFQDLADRFSNLSEHGNAAALRAPHKDPCDELILSPSRL
jgi:hypothetical protein